VRDTSKNLKLGDSRHRRHPPLALARKYACVVLLTSIFFFFGVRQKNAGFSSDRTTLAQIRIA
jgi:hypothetical protein